MTREEAAKALARGLNGCFLRFDDPPDFSERMLADMFLALTAPAASGEAMGLDAPHDPKCPCCGSTDKGYMRPKCMRSEGYAPHPWHDAPTPQPGPVGREEHEFEEALEMFQEWAVAYGQAAEGTKEENDAHNDMHRAKVKLRWEYAKAAAANKRVEVVTKAARAMVDSQWEHRCADKVGGCTAVNSVLLDALDAATREGDTTPTPESEAK